MCEEKCNCETCMEYFDLIDGLVTYILDLEATVARLQSADSPDNDKLYLPYCDFSKIKAYRKYVEYSWLGEDPLTSETHLAEMWRDIAKNRNPRDLIPF